MENPANPIEAVTHPDPYAYYAHLVENQPIYYDQTLRMWVASSARAVQAVLANPLARVRPVSEPVPTHLAGSPSASIFGQLVRMNDGRQHEVLKPVISKTLAACAPTQISQVAYNWSQTLLDDFDFLTEPGKFSDFAFQLPVYVVASLLGINDEQLPIITASVKAYVQSLNPAKPLKDEDKTAVANLLNLFNRLEETVQADLAQSSGLFNRLVQEAQLAGGITSAQIVANAIGFLSQSYEATAGLIGNALVILANRSEIRSQLVTQPDLLAPFLQEVLRYDPPVQNTRRFMADDTTIESQTLRASETVLVVLAAANRDPMTNVEPDRFELFREDRQNFSFSYGVHACPGRDIATLVAKAALEILLTKQLIPARLEKPVAYQPSANARIPCW